MEKFPKIDNDFPNVEGVKFLSRDEAQLYNDFYGIFNWYRVDFNHIAYKLTDKELPDWVDVFKKISRIDYNRFNKQGDHLRIFCVRNDNSTYSFYTNKKLACPLIDHYFNNPNYSVALLRMSYPKDTGFEHSPVLEAAFDEIDKCLKDMTTGDHAYILSKEYILGDTYTTRYFSLFVGDSFNEKKDVIEKIQDYCDDFVYSLIPSYAIFKTSYALQFQFLNVDDIFFCNSLFMY